MRAAADRIIGNLIGQTLSHFKVIAKLGQGGMGEVYRAEDTTLGREVAIKVLPTEFADDADRLERFEREAQAASALNHPNICTIHELGTHEGRRFLVMEVLEGETLQSHLEGQPLSPDRVISIGLQVADALDAAHSKGIVHRDIKPANLFLTERGDLKVLDFGLAKLRSDTVSVDSEVPTELAARSLTRVGSTIGTVAYMSPEQARGEALDPRSDLFSLGVVLYELSSGQVPFDGNTSAVVFSEILGKNPPPLTQINPSVPMALDAVITRALEKDPDLRYQSAADLGADLKRLVRDSDSQSAIRAAPTTPKKSKRGLWIGLGLAALVVTVVGITRQTDSPSPSRAAPQTESTIASQISIAVLPFQNLGTDTSTEYLRLAVPDEITNTLARTPSLAVRPLASTMVYSDGAVDLPTAGKDLHASNLITGQYFSAGEQLQITVEAVNVEGNMLVWRETLSVPAGDLSELRNQVGSAIRRGLLPKLGVSKIQETSAAPRGNDEAYLLYARSLAASTDPTPNKEALDLLDRSIELDPGFAQAWAALSLRYYYHGQYSDGGEEAFRLAEQAAETAIELDPSNTEAATYLVQRKVDKGDLEGAYLEAQRSFERRPDSAKAIFARSYVYRYAGMLDEALEDCNRAYRLDPTNSVLRSCSLAFLMNDDTDRARDFANLDSGSDWANGVTARILLAEGRIEESARLLETIRESSSFKSEIEYIQHCQSSSPEAKAAVSRTLGELHELRLDDPEPKYWTSAQLATCGFFEEAFPLLRAAVSNNYCAFPGLDRDPSWRELRDNPTFREIRSEAMACRKRFEEFLAKAGQD